MRLLPSFLAVALIASFAGRSIAQEPTYSKDVKPFLQKYCVDCHQGAKAKAGIHLDTYEGLFKASKKTPVVAGNPDKSAMVTCTEGTGRKMPPKKAKNQPTADEITVLRKWVQAGAKNDAGKQSRLTSEDEISTVAFEDAVKLKAGDRIVFLGDSITAGGNGGKGYINVIRKHLADKKADLKVECIGAGISGNKVPDLQRRVEKDVVARKPSIVFIYIGINDVWHGENNPANGTSPERFEAGLKEVIGKIEKGGAKVVLCTPTVIGEQKNGTNKNDKKLDDYADISRKVAKEGNLTLCDLRKAFVDYIAAHNEKNAASGVLTSDRVHLNEAGNRLVAETMLKSLGE